MRRFSLPYGEGELSLEMTSGRYCGTFLPNKIASASSERAILEHALEHPIGAPLLRDLVQPTNNVVIVTSDLTRPCPNEVILPPLIKELNAAGVPDENISIVIALGLHRKMSKEELRKSVGDELFRRIQVLNHDLNDVVYLGETSRGTPVEIFRHVLDADFRVCVGNVEFHYFAGFSGGAKAIVPGVASERSVNANHSHMINDEATAAHLDGNPVREDLEEAVEMVGVDYVLNVIVDEHMRVVHARAGHVHKAHRELCRLLDQEGLVPIREQLDLAIVSAGGYPKDIDLYQAQKALDNCAGAVKPGGVLILLAECSEGYGNNTFSRWMQSGKTPQGLLADIREKFVLGGHKAAAIAKNATNITILLVANQVLASEEMVGISLAKDWEHAWEQTRRLLGEDFSYGVFPLGASTLPKLVK